MIDIPNRNVIAGKHTFVIFFLLATTIFNTPAVALQMVAEPIYPIDQAEQVYAPLASYLGNHINQTIELVTPANFQQHWLLVRQGSSPDIVIEEAPLTDFWLRYKGYTPLVRSERALSFSLVTLSTEYQSINDLFMLPIATMPSPSTEYLILTRWFENPFWQPQIVSSSTSSADSVQLLWDGVVSAAILPTPIAETYPQFRTIRTSETMPGLTISVAPWVDKALQQQLQRILLSLNDDAGNYTVLDELNLDRLVPAIKSEYLGYAEWLRKINIYNFPEIFAEASSNQQEVGIATLE